MPLLFSYGTLQEENVQLATFGRLLQGQRDELPGFEQSLVKIEDPQVVAASGKTHHANVTFNGKTTVNDISLLAVLVTGKDFPNFRSKFRNRLTERLRRMGLPQETISVERAAMEIVQIQPSNSKSVLASMNDFVKNLKWQVGAHFNFLEANALEDLLSETPIGALNYQYPIEVAAAAFGLDWKAGRPRWPSVVSSSHEPRRPTMARQPHSLEKWPPVNSKLQPNVLHCIGNTRLLALRNIVPGNGSRILLKLENENPTGSMKDRMALGMIEAAESEGQLTKNGSVVEYTGGSTGVSLSLVCAVKGYPLYIVTSDAFSREKLDHMRILGATLQIVRSESGGMTEKLTRDMIEAARVIAEKTWEFLD